MSLASSLTVALLLGAYAPRMIPDPDGGEDRLRYLYALTANTGKTKLDAPSMSFDPQSREVFLLFADDLRVYNSSGMESYRFERFPDLGRRMSVTPLGGGDLLVGAMKEGRPKLFRCDYRGRPIGEFTLSGVPPELVGVGQSGPFRVGERLYFQDATGKRLAVTSLDGQFLAARDLTIDFGEDEHEKLEESDLERRGFWIDEKENVYLTFPMIFHVAVLGPDGKRRGFGQKGSAADKFNVIAGVVADEDGYVYVADLLKSTVMVFNPSFQYVGHIAGIARPARILYADGKLFVAQGGKFGIAVFEVLRKH